MKYKLLVAIQLSIFFVACTPQKVDKVPSVTDIHNIKVNNQKIPQSKFIKIYCINVDLSNITENEVTTCESKKAAAKQDFTKGGRSSGNW